MAHQHGGNLAALARLAGCRPDDILDFSASMNPLGMPEGVRAAVSRSLTECVHYPDPAAGRLVAAVAQAYALAPADIIPCNGTSEALWAIAHAAAQAGWSRAVLPVPSYADYARAAAAAGLVVTTLPLAEAVAFRLDYAELQERLQGREVVFLGQPNNPTGLELETRELRAFIRTHPHTLFVVDEAFSDFIPGFTSLTVELPENAVVLHSLTKFYAIPGLRVGFCMAAGAWGERVRRQLPSWSVNTLAEAVATVCLADTEFAVVSRDYVTQERTRFAAALAQRRGVTVFPSVANFLLLRLDGPVQAQGLADRLLRQQRMALRGGANFAGLDERFLRVAVRTRADNDRLLEAWSDDEASVCGNRVANPSVRRRRARTPAIMFQGTTSNAGKSVLTAALCRILLQDGLKVAPFKAQNMSLNSAVTRDGGEIGRAQAVQATACRLEPDSRMNPVLLKPHAGKSQVILQGKAIGHWGWREYMKFRETAFQTVCTCYDGLAAEVDVMVLEGAGSPAEVNLKKSDIVNMRMAQYAQAPVLLVGDIDRGGVFAHFIGCVETFAPWERDLLAGFVINRFRGDKSLLGSALDYTLNFTGKPVLGVVPYLPDLGLPQEDSVDFKNLLPTAAHVPPGVLDIAVVDLPHISNFTDLDALGQEPDLKLRIVRSADLLGTPAAVIIPGSKNVPADLQWLRRNGLAEAISQLAGGATTEIVGICGGFQMLGQAILDPHCVETVTGASLPGLGLLAVDTTMATEKLLRRCQAKHLPSGHAVYGYEIHHGRTVMAPQDVLLVLSGAGVDGEPVGAMSQASNGRIWGTYLHGIFDADEFRRWFIDGLRRRQGLAPAGTLLTHYTLEPALERLAAHVRESLDMKHIYRLLGL